MGDRGRGPSAVAGRTVAGRDFRLFWFGETASLLGTSIGSVALPLVAVVALGAGPFTVGLLTAVAWLPWLVFGLPAGVWIDRLSRRRMMLVCNGVSFAAFASIPVAAWFGALSTGHLLVAATVGGCANVFFTTAYRAYLPALLAHGELLSGNTWLQGSASTMQVLGPGAAGLLAQSIGAVSGLAADALSFGVSALCLRAIRTVEPRPEARRRRLRDEVARGLRFITRDPFLRGLVAFSAVSNVALTGMSSIEVVFLVDTLDAGQGAVGLVLAVCGCGGVVGAVLSARIAGRFGTARAALLCQGAAASMALLMPLAGPGAGLLFFAVGGAGLGCGVVASCVITDTFRQQYCPPGLIARVSASSAVVTYGAIPLGGLLGGGLGSALGVRTTLWCMTVLQALSLTILLAGPIRGLRDFPLPGTDVKPVKLKS
ncbi:MFS transporter [Streptomyces violaceusniger]|uniref:MFS transporter n=1 Tax=Streptomyces violaceusniger TaxID=68280 RepID=UPI0034238894